MVQHKIAAASSDRPTMRDVAALAGVGIKTVSRVVNDEPNVSSETKQRVHRAITQLNYQPDINAGNLKRSDGRTGAIGLLVGNVANPFSGAIHRAVETEARRRGVAVFAASLDEDPLKEAETVRGFLRRRVDGLILTTATANQRYLLPEIQRGVPIVFIDREARGISVDAVVTENRAGAATGARHLLARGHRRIAYLGDDLMLQTAGERLAGFRDALAEAGSTAEIPPLNGPMSVASAETAIGTLLDAPEPPTAILTGQNLATIGAVRALHARGLEHRIALVGFDDFSLADLLSPGVTVVAQDPSSIGARAAQRLFARLDGDTGAPQTVRLPTTLIERGSGEISPGPQPPRKGITP